MPTQKGGYYLASGERVPSVTTILGRFKDAGALMYWAWTEGKEGRDYKQTRDDAANSGTQAHAAVESWLKGQEYFFSADEIGDRAYKAFQAFKEWAAQTQLSVTDPEVAMISERHKFGGTADGFTMKGKRAVLDWKASNGIYGDYLMQVAAYGALWDETHPDDKIVAGYHLVRFDKKYGDFHHHYWGELDSAWRGFLLLRELYDIDKELKARAK